MKRASCRFALLMLVLLFATTSFASSEADLAFDRLSKVKHYAFGGIGYAGVASAGETDYRVIMSQPNATSYLEKLFVKGNFQAKCYALFGIHKLDINRFKQLAQPLRNSTDKVTTMRGCIVSHEQLGQIIDRIEKSQS